MKILAWIIGVPVGAFLLLLLIGSLSGPPSEESNKRMAIDLCWQDQGKKSLEPAIARTVAGWCEKMESDFQAKYGVRP